MRYSFDYKEYGEIEKRLSAVEEKVIRDHFKTIADGNCALQDDLSQPEMGHAFWLFRYGWICRSMCTNKEG